MSKNCNFEIAGDDDEDTRHGRQEIITHTTQILSSSSPLAEEPFHGAAQHLLLLFLREAPAPQIGH